VFDADCDGECGGSAEYDDCGVCEGDGTSCSVILEFGDVNVSAGTLEIVMTNSTPVGGFQFVITISSVPAETLTSPNSNITLQLVPSPSHTPQSSYSAEPPHSPSISLLIAIFQLLDT
jgi:hypothetical protein